MAYTKQTWTDGVFGATPISASRLTYMELGIEAGARSATTANEGNVELATQGEMNLGTDTARVPSVAAVAAYVAAFGGGGGGGGSTSPATTTTLGTVMIASQSVMDQGLDPDAVPPVSVVATYVASHAPTISGASTTSPGTVTLATTGIMNIGTDTGRVPPVSTVASYVTSQLPIASTEATAGIARIATQTQSNTGTNDTAFLTPLKMKTTMGVPVRVLALTDPAPSDGVPAIYFRRTT